MSVARSHDPPRSATGWRRVVESAADVVIIAAPDGTMLWVSPSSRQLAGYAPDELLGTSGFAYIHADDLPRVQRYWSDCVSTAGAHPALEFRVRDTQGEWVWIEERVTNLTEDPQVGGLVAYLHDITARMRQTAATAEAEAKYRTIVQTADEGIGIVDLQGQIVFANAQLGAVLGYDEQVDGRNVLDFIDPEDVPLVLSRIGRVQEVPERLQLNLRHRDGHVVHASVGVVPLDVDAPSSAGHGRVEPEGATALVLVRDDTERVRRERDLHRSVLRDAVTDLPNRTLLLAQLEHERSRLAPGRSAAVVLLDLDGFSDLNHALGTVAGDQVLQRVAQRLRQAAGPGDLVARYGADEFVVVAVEATSPAQASECAERLLAAIGLPLSLGGEDLRLTASAGVALTDDTDSDTLLRAAGMALTTAKAQGRGHVVMQSEGDTTVPLARWRLERDLGQALKRHELSLVYQPIVDLSSGEVVAAEALARWTSPLRGPVPPDQFIGLAERCGLIDEIGAWVLGEACRAAAEWPAAARGQRPSLCVNLSVLQLCDPQLPGFIEAVLDECGLPPTSLVLEVTETGVLADLDAAVKAMGALKDLGVRLHIDDFGTGHASLVYVSHFPVDALKVDKVFVRGLGVRDADTAIVTSTIALARARGLQVIAEGVETEAQAQLLRQAGCDLGQGYLWSRPITQDDWLITLDRLEAQSAVRPAQPRPSPDAVARIVELAGAGRSPTTIAAALNKEGFNAPSGRRWHRMSVTTVLDDFLASPARRPPSG